MESRPKLSIVVASVLPWPALRENLESLYAQACAVGAELIIGVREDGLPEDAYPEAVRVIEPDGTLFSLRASGFAKARGEIIAMTEDHCRVHPTWCESVLRAHEKHPKAMAIIGCVENTARQRLSDWAIYLLGNGAFMSPLPSGFYTGAVTSANASFKRSAFPDTFPSFGWCGDWHTKWLQERGEAIVLDDTSAVDHHLPLPMKRAFVLFYLSARAAAGLRADLPPGKALLRAGVRILCIPANAVRTGLRVAVHKGRFRAAAIASIPAVAALMLAHQVGSLLGALRGPGNADHLVY